MLQFPGERFCSPGNRFFALDFYSCDFVRAMPDPQSPRLPAPAAGEDRGACNRGGIADGRRGPPPGLAGAESRRPSDSMDDPGSLEGQSHRHVSAFDREDQSTSAGGGQAEILAPISLGRAEWIGVLLELPIREVIRVASRLTYLGYLTVESSGAWTLASDGYW
jgi:hypothetical protein